jgi:hypothetical protein
VGDSRAMMVINKKGKTMTEVISSLNKKSLHRIMKIKIMNPCSYPATTNLTWRMRRKG